MELKGFVVHLGRREMKEMKVGCLIKRGRDGGRDLSLSLSRAPFPCFR